MTMPDVSSLPEDVDEAYVDDPTDPAVKIHQKHHTTVHKAIKALAAAQPTGAFHAQRAAVHHDPSASPNGAISAGAVLDAGTVLNNSGTGPIKYASGRFAHDAGATVGATSAGYLQVDTGSDSVRLMLAEVAWAPNALGALAIVIPSTLATWNSPSAVPAAGVHLTAYGNGIWNMACWNPGGGAVGKIDNSIQPGTAASFTVTVQTTTPSGTQTTAALTTATLTAASLQAALEGLSNVGAGKVTVTKSKSGNYGIVWAASLGATTVTAAGAGMGMAAPLPLSPGNTIPAVVTYGTGITIYGDYLTVGRYATVWDNKLRWFETYVFPETDEVLLVFPDGSNSGMMKHPSIGLWTSSRGVFELFENNSSAIDTPATLGRIAVGNARVQQDSPVTSKTSVLGLLAAKQAITLYEGTNTTAADITARGSIPPGIAFLELILIAGSGGGGSGACQPSGTAANGGGAGGSGGIIREIIPASALGTSWAATVGRGGAGGASVSATSVGNPGAVGSLSKFASGGAVYQALAAGGGSGGNPGATVANGGGAGGPFATGGSSNGGNGVAGSNGVGIVANLGVPGSASGGGVTAAAVATNGGIGGSNLVRGLTGGTAGIVGGSAPGVGTDGTATVVAAPVAGVPGPGVGGGAGSAVGAAQAGASPVMYGVGGGGGGASLAGSASGGGGNGIGGYVLIRAHLF